jgi:hypothetical protein
MDTARFRRWVAKKLCPDLVLAEARFLKLRSELSTDMQWLGYDFPEIDVFAYRALAMDANYGRALDAPPYSLECGGVKWSNDIREFRDQLREKFNRTPQN